MFNEYLSKIFNKFQTGDASERTYYSVLEYLLTELSNERVTGGQVLIEPKKSSVGIPDFKIQSPKGLLIGYIEAKDLGRDLDHLNPDEQNQIQKYLKEYPKLILTNYIEFRLFENGSETDRVTITQPVTLKIKTPVLDNEPRANGLFEKFFSTTIQEVRTARRLAELLAHKTRVVKDLVLEEINLEDSLTTSTEELFEVFKKTLRPDLSPEVFADMYAQTVTFGLFVARLNSKEANFTRASAFDYIPKTIQLLRRLFHVLSGQDLPQHIAWHVDEIAEILANTKIERIKEDFFSLGKGRDPIIHFYETFLSEYDPGEREKMGVYYTPEQVVSYIARSVNTILKEKLGKSLGFADESVVILDPASGTQTFPAKAIAIAKEEYTKKHGEGGWEQLVRKHILNDFYSFEILMAPYSVGHLKIGLILEELGYKFTEEDRFKLFLTNTLSFEKVKPAHLLLANEIAEESEHADEVKHKKPVLVVLGNPPYSGESQNKGEKILKLIEDYKKINGVPLGERNSKWLQDDYVKFIRFAQWKIDQAGTGVIGFITNHAWLDNTTFRGMRASLLKDFDEIYILNLHGSSLKKEKTPTGSKDENVFDIMPGVAITLAVRTGKSEKKVFHADLWGLREEKYEWLNSHKIDTTDWKEIFPVDEDYLFVPVSLEGRKTYQTFWDVTEIFPLSSVGIVTARDRLCIQWSKNDMWTTAMNFASMDTETARSAYNLGDDARDWKVDLAQDDLKSSGLDQSLILPINYRPFDKRWTYYTGHSRGFICMPRPEVMKQMIKPNLGLVLCRQYSGDYFNHAFVTDTLTESCYISNKTKEIGYIFPLYLHKDEAKVEQVSLLTPEAGTPGEKTNISPEVLDKLQQSFGTSVSPEAIFGYVYAVLYATSFRSSYQEFLKRDFPRIPFTKNYELFQNLSTLGKKLTDLHLLKSEELGKSEVKFYGKGDGSVNEVKFEDLSVVTQWEGEKPNNKLEGGIIRVNSSQFFGSVSKKVWEYQIGGYQVLEKWLKDRKGRVLSLDEIRQYCEIVSSIEKTIEFQEEIDNLYPEVEKSLI